MEKKSFLGGTKSPAPTTVDVALNSLSRCAIYIQTISVGNEGRAGKKMQFFTMAKFSRSLAVHHSSWKSQPSLRL